MIVITGISLERWHMGRGKPIRFWR